MVHLTCLTACLTRRLYTADVASKVNLSIACRHALGRGSLLAAAFASQYDVMRICFALQCGGKGLYL
jgi:Ca2+/H+ antiporter